MVKGRSLFQPQPQAPSQAFCADPISLNSTTRIEVASRISWKMLTLKPPFDHRAYRPSDSACRYRGLIECSNCGAMETIETKGSVYIAVDQAKPSTTYRRRFYWMSPIQRISWRHRHAANATTTFRSTKNIWHAYSNVSYQGVPPLNNCTGPRSHVSFEGIPRFWPDYNVHGQMAKKVQSGPSKTIA
jgi:hypothetical protein